MSEDVLTLAKKVEEEFSNSSKSLEDYLTWLEYFADYLIVRESMYLRGRSAIIFYNQLEKSVRLLVKRALWGGYSKAIVTHLSNAATYFSNINSIINPDSSSIISANPERDPRNDFFDYSNKAGQELFEAFRNLKFPPKN